MKPGVLGLIDHPHATATELFEDAIVRDGLADKRVGVWHLLHMLGWGRRQVNEVGQVPFNALTGKLNPSVRQRLEVEMCSTAAERTTVKQFRMVRCGLVEESVCI